MDTILKYFLSYVFLISYHHHKKGKTKIFRGIFLHFLLQCERVEYEKNLLILRYQSDRHLRNGKRKVFIWEKTVERVLRNGLQI